MSSILNQEKCHGALPSSSTSLEYNFFGQQHKAAASSTSYGLEGCRYLECMQHNSTQMLPYRVCWPHERENVGLHRLAWVTTQLSHGGELIKVPTTYTHVQQELSIEQLQGMQSSDLYSTCPKTAVDQDPLVFFQLPHSSAIVVT